MTNMSLRVGIDIGGTFTDFVIYNPLTKELLSFKLLSTPHDPAEAVLTGLSQILAKFETEAFRKQSQGLIITHGSTVATNTLLERKGAITALVTTSGFRDILEIARQNRPSLYDLSAKPPPVLIPASCRLELKERTNKNGEIITPINLQDIDNLIEKLINLNVESVAVCFLFSFLTPINESIVGKRLRQKGFFVSLSSEIIPEYREYERTSTTVVNAYVTPRMEKYLLNLENKLTSILSGHQCKARLNVMQSNGGTILPAEARNEAVRCILSGPAGGVVGCEYLGKLSLLSTKQRRDNYKNHHLKLITFDMGGTSTDVSLIDGASQITTETIVGGRPIRIPMLHIHTIGAGGGSIAHVDPGGALCVGPESAGAEPGPACYGRGSKPTVTDANILLRRIPPDYFLGGKMPLDINRAEESFRQICKNMNMSPVEAALGVVEVVNAHMERALRVITVERGHDPRDFTLLSFGGAGGLHAADLARNLGIPKVLIPPLASTLSAFGMITADVIKDSVRTVMLPGTTSNLIIESKLKSLSKIEYKKVLAEGIDAAHITVDYYLDMRYVGQSYELILPYNPSFVDHFHKAHYIEYGYTKPSSAIEIVNLRVRVLGKTTPPPISKTTGAGPDPHAAFIDRRIVVFENKELLTPFFRGDDLRPENQITGPAVVVRSDTTIIIGPYDNAVVDPLNNLHIQVGN